MTLADCSFGAFALLNTARLLGYVPQILNVHRDRSGAKAVSVFTWMLFSAANIATVSYAIIVSNDATMAIIFALNTIGCLTIVGLTIWRRFEMHKVSFSDGASHEKVLGASNNKILKPINASRSKALAEMADWVVLYLLRRSSRSYRGGLFPTWIRRH